MTLVRERPPATARLLSESSNEAGGGDREGSIIGARGQRGLHEKSGSQGFTRVQVFVSNIVVALGIFARFGVVAGMGVTSATTALDKAKGGKEEAEALVKERDGEEGAGGNGQEGEGLYLSPLFQGRQENGTMESHDSCQLSTRLLKILDY